MVLCFLSPKKIDGTLWDWGNKKFNLLLARFKETQNKNKKVKVVH